MITNLTECLTTVDVRDACDCLQDVVSIALTHLTRPEFSAADIRIYRELGPFTQR
jgi:hypothetical protein